MVGADAPRKFFKIRTSRLLIRALKTQNFNMRKFLPLNMLCTRIKTTLTVQVQVKTYPYSAALVKTYPYGALAEP